MTETIFDLIIANKIPSWIIWQDDNFIAFLTPFPNTPGVTVVIPKSNPGDYIFDLDNNLISNLMIASKTVSKLLQKALNVKRVAMVVEGTGVAYVHVKLYPLHGKLGQRTDVLTNHQEFYPEYIGYLSTAEGPKMSDQELDSIQKKILQVGQK
jgi:diadenosine tetraphosphate (Ap4A) HIT family hydrolase